MDKKRWALLIGGFALVALAYFGAPRTHAATSQITGTIQDAQGNAVNGTLTFQLPVPAVDTATNTAIAPIIENYKVLNGVIQPGPPLYDVVGLQPKNLYYAAKVYDQSGNLILSGNYVVTGGTFNFGAAVPTTVTTSNISYLTPVSLSNPNTFTATQSFPTITSTSASPAATGFIRMANTDQLCYRNASNSGDLCVVPQLVGGNNAINVNGIDFYANNVQSPPSQPLFLSAGSGGNGIQMSGTNNPTAGGSGGPAALIAGNGNTTGAGGDVFLTPGSGGAAGSGGNVVIASRTFVNLGTPPSGNGSIIMCSDCTIANPCAGGGTGALAKRLNGAWVCN